MTAGHAARDARARRPRRRSSSRREGQLRPAAAPTSRSSRTARVPEELEQAHARALQAAAAFEETKAGARKEEVAAAGARLAAQEVALEKARIDAERSTRSGEDRLRRRLAGGHRRRRDSAAAGRGRHARRAPARSSSELKNGSRQEDVQQAEARSLQAAASEHLVRAGTRAEDLAIARGQVEAAQGRVDQIKTHDRRAGDPRAARRARGGAATCAPATSSRPTRPPRRCSRRASSTCGSTCPRR